MRVRVTARDIKNGLPCRCEYCPVALAAIRAALSIGISNDRGRISVDDDYLWIGLESYPLPVEAQCFIKSFDTGGEVAPLEFELDVPLTVEGTSAGE